MSSDSALVDLPLPDDALAALMASPGFQAQMAALTQQAMASLEGLVAFARRDCPRHAGGAAAAGGRD